jgi:hypothetical protein
MRVKARGIDNRPQGPQGPKLEFRNVDFSRREENQITRRKTLLARERTNKQLHISCT